MRTSYAPGGAAGRSASACCPGDAAGWDGTVALTSRYDLTSSLILSVSQCRGTPGTSAPALCDRLAAAAAVRKLIRASRIVSEQALRADDRGIATAGRCSRERVSTA